MKMPKLTRLDKVALLILVIFVVLASIPIYADKAGCEVARPGYKCLTAKEVMVEHCDHWGKWDCNSAADISLPQVEWYIDNLCSIHNQYHDDKLECANLKLACNQAAGKETCPIL